MGQEEWLEETAKFSIFTSVAVVIFFLTYAIVRIYRMPNHLWKDWRQAKNRAVEVFKKPVELAYILKLKEDTTGVSNNVSFHLKCNRRAEIKLLWGVSVPYLFDLMRCTWDDFEKMVKVPPVGRQGPSSSRAESYHAIEDLALPDSGFGFDDYVTVSPPSHLHWENLKNKYRYPLAVLVYRPKDTEDENADSGTEIHGLFTILHVKSEIFPMPTTVLAHYIKMDNGNTFLLKPLYLVEDDLDIDDNDSQNDSGISDSNTPDGSVQFPGVCCSVCQALPVTRAILPCGHVCLCVFCFEKVERCPICRGEMQFFFRTREEDPKEAARFHQQEFQEMQRHRSWFDTLEYYGDRLNAWFGFT